MAVDFKDYYKILGVDRKPTTKTIKSAWRLARKHHPDVAKAVRTRPSGSRRSTKRTRCSPILKSAAATTRSDPTGSAIREPRPAPGGGGGFRVEYGGDAERGTLRLLSLHLR
jgi:curved DNA-binding protein